MSSFVVGAFLLAGQVIFVRNVGQSWLEGPRVSVDPWNLKEEAPGRYGREYRWFERCREDAVVTDGGNEGGQGPRSGRESGTRRD